MLNVSQLQNDKAERVLPDGASRVRSYNSTYHDVNMWTHSFCDKDSSSFYLVSLFVCFKEEASGDLFTQGLAQWHKELEGRNREIYRYKGHTETTINKNSWFWVINLEFWTDQSEVKVPCTQQACNFQLNTNVTGLYQAKQKRMTTYVSTTVKNPNLYVKCD